MALWSCHRAGSCTATVPAAGVGDRADTKRTPNRPEHHAGAREAVARATRRKAASMVTRTTELLSDDMLARFDERAPVYDRENRFFDEDFEELKQSGYLLLAVPTEFGGSGLGLDEYSKLQRQP